MLTAIPSPSISLTGDYDQDLSWGQNIQAAEEALQWIIGDYVNAMCDRYEDSARNLTRDLAAATDKNWNTLRGYGMVARAIDPALRRATVSYSHYKEIAGSDHPAALVAMVEDDGLSVRDTRRVVQGLPLGGEAEATKTSSAANVGSNLEETALLDIETARLHLQRALETISRAGFRLTVGVGQDIMGKLEALSKPFVAIEDAVKAEVGALL